MDQDYHLYAFKPSKTTDLSWSLPDGCTLVRSRPTLARVRKGEIRLPEYLWKLLTFNRCHLYEVFDRDHRLLHRSLHIGKNIKFRFLHGRKDYEIGPCFTSEPARGQGLYPTVLKCILRDYPDANHFMLIRDSNISSIRGASKAGFVKTVPILRTPLGIWRESRK